MLQAALVGMNTIFIRYATTRLWPRLPGKLPATTSSGRGARGPVVNAIRCIGVATLRTQTRQWPGSYAVALVSDCRVLLFGAMTSEASSSARRVTFIVAGWRGVC